MVGLLVTLFAGTIAMIYLDGVVPTPNETVPSQLAHRSFGSAFTGQVMYAFTQAATATILLLAANTAYNDFPRVLFLLARDFHAPRIFLRMGDRLAFTNGILLLSVAAAAIYLAFGGKTDPLRRALQVSHRPAGCTPLRWRSGQASNDGRCWCGRSEVGLAVR